MTKFILVLGLALTLGAPASFARNNNTVGQPEKNNSGLQHPEFGDNILRLNPIMVLDIGVGPGISYERMISADKKVSIILPFSLLLQDEGYYTNNNGTKYTTYFYFTPGLKLYPFGQRTVTYAVGPNLMLGYGGGDVQSSVYDPALGSTKYYQIRKQVFRLGILVNNYVNSQIMPSLSLGLTAGLGARYIDYEKQTFSGKTKQLNRPIDITGQFAFSLGYRF